MSVLIISDSHGMTDTLQTIKQRHNVSFMIHCGDSELDMDAKEMQGFVKVGGNVDFDVRYPDEETVKIEGLDFYITHGHLVKVNQGLLNLSYRARENNAQIVCFGHTHKAGAEKIGSQLFINPGSIKESRDNKKETYAILNVQSDSHVQVDFYDIEGSPNRDISASFHIDDND